VDARRSSCSSVPRNSLGIELAYSLSAVDQAVKVGERFSGGEGEETQAHASAEHYVEYINCAPAMAKRFAQPGEGLLVP